MAAHVTHRRPTCLPHGVAVGDVQQIRARLRRDSRFTTHWEMAALTCSGRRFAMPDVPSLADVDATWRLHFHDAALIREESI